MKKFLKLISIFIIILVAYIASLNITQTVNFNIWKNISQELSLIYIILGALIAGLTISYTWMLTNYLTSQEKFKEYKKKLEQTTVFAESDSSKVSVLEAKIEVLEKALKSTLEKND